jgi:hypothetical protein
MEDMHMQGGRVVRLLALVAVLECSLIAQKPSKDQQQEQTTFGSDAASAEEFTRKPVEVPAGALQVLRDTLTMDRGTLYCIKKGGLEPDQVSASWFVGSEIHLDGPEEVDLIVRPNVFKLGTRELPEAASCLLGAHVIPFWVLRNIGGRYSLLLETWVVTLGVLSSRTNGYRDIQTISSTAVTRTTLLYKMDVAQYQLAEKKTEP